MGKADINEKYLYKKYPKVLEMLLIDKTTNNNIIWATESYTKNGYSFFDNIKIDNIINENIIIPRAKKIKEEQTKRAQKNAEVFTPSWMCNIQNNIIDKAWLKANSSFNTEKKKAWVTNSNKIEFDNNKNWIDYIKNLRLEISCGEAPYIVSRYDTVSGKYIELENRIGIIDRKFRVLNENCDDNEEWTKYSMEILKSTYGYEWQGDNVLLARENVLFSYIDYYKNKFGKMPSESILLEAANIISWNIWQMDGLKCVIPQSCEKNNETQISFFDDEKINNKINSHDCIYSKIMNWNNNKTVKFFKLFDNYESEK